MFSRFRRLKIILSLALGLSCMHVAPTSATIVELIVLKLGNFYIYLYGDEHDLNDRNSLVQAGLLLSAATTTPLPRLIALELNPNQLLANTFKQLSLYPDVYDYSDQHEMINYIMQPKILSNLGVDLATTNIDAERLEVNAYEALEEYCEKRLDRDPNKVEGVINSIKLFGDTYNGMSEVKRLCPITHIDHRLATTLCLDLVQRLQAIDPTPEVAKFEKLPLWTLDNLLIEQQAILQYHGQLKARTAHLTNVHPLLDQHLKQSRSAFSHALTCIDLLLNPTLMACMQPDTFLQQISSPPSAEAIMRLQGIRDHALTAIFRTMHERQAAFLSSCESLDAQSTLLNCRPLILEQLAYSLFQATNSLVDFDCFYRITTTMSVPTQGPQKIMVFAGQGHTENLTHLLQACGAKTIFSYNAEDDAGDDDQEPSFEDLNEHIIGTLTLPVKHRQ